MILLKSPTTVCVIAIVALISTVWVTCWFTEEEEREEQFGQKKGLVLQEPQIWLRGS